MHENATKINCDPPFEIQIPEFCLGTTLQTKDKSLQRLNVLM